MASPPRISGTSRTTTPRRRFKSPDFRTSPHYYSPMPRPSRFATATSVCGSLIVAAALNAPPATAAPSCSSTTPALDEQVTCTYSSGGFTDITVPAGAEHVSITLDGAGGGGGGGMNNPTDVGASGGRGARVQATIDITGITSLRLVLGSPGSGATFGGGGGGYSALYSGASTAANDVLAVAGGGGGGGGMNGGTSIMVGGRGAASGTAAGGSGVGPGNGAPGDGSGGTGSGGADGASWAAGGAGGAGNDVDSGKGGAGYGGGEEGDIGVINGGGGAGGSFVDPAALVGLATYSPNGGAGGSGVAGSMGNPGSAGGVVLTFSATPTPPATPGEDQTPPPVLLQIGRLPGTDCPSGWNPSWASWAQTVTGGPVCTQTAVYLRGSWVIEGHPDVSFDPTW